jgi:hypothetical protein
MGQHRRDIQRIYQRPEKNSQSAFRQNPRDALQTQGSGLAMSKLWDGSDSSVQFQEDRMKKWLLLLDLDSCFFHR